jgi:hypothetical protein
VGLAVGAQRQHQPEGGDVHGGRRAAVAQEGERHSCRGDQAEVACHRDRDLDADQGREPGRGQRCGAVAAVATGADDPPHEHRRGEHGRRPGQDPELLDDAGERQVGVPVRQVEPHQLVQRVVRAAGQAAPGQGDVHLPDRPPGPVGVGGPAQEGVQPLLLVGVEQLLGERQRDGSEDEQRQEHPERDPPEHQHRPGQGAQEQCGRQVGLEEDEADGHGGHERGSREPTWPRPVAPEDQGQHEEQAELGELGRLHREGAEGDPPLGAPDRHAPHVDRDQQHDADAVAAPRQPAQAGGTPPAEDDEEHHAADHDDQLVPYGPLVAEGGEVGQAECREERHRPDGEGVEEARDGEAGRAARLRAGRTCTQQSALHAEHGRLAARGGPGDGHRGRLGAGGCRRRGDEHHRAPLGDRDRRGGVDARPAGLRAHVDRG